ncbi:Protein kinase superfamily protein [Raphanus sativus]|nr:Protein kinase superfamily protein [Raphanus sativus]
MFLSTEEETLPWKTRVKIAIGIAQAIVFLHSINKIPLHHELDMHNIMLDEQYSSKWLYLDSKNKLIGDKGRIVATTYLPLEYAMNGHAGVKTDVFTYGVILLELFTGSKGGEICLNSLDIRTRSFGETIDHRLESDYPTHAAAKMGRLIRRCTKRNWTERPSMQHVLDVLNYIACKY